MQLQQQSHQQQQPQQVQVLAVQHPQQQPQPSSQQKTTPSLLNMANRVIKLWFILSINLHLILSLFLLNLTIKKFVIVV